MTFVKVAETLEVPVGQMKVFNFAERQVLIVNLEGAYYAIGNACTHRKGELSKGILEGKTVTCPKHAARFDVATGKVVSGPKVFLMHPKVKDEPVYAVKIEGEDILLERE